MISSISLECTLDVRKGPNRRVKFERVTSFGIEAKEREGVTDTVTGFVPLVNLIGGDPKRYVKGQTVGRMDATCVIILLLSCSEAMY